MWSFYHKAIVINVWKIKVNELIDITCFYYNLHIEK